MEVIWRFIWSLYGDYMIRGSMVIVYLDLPKCVCAIWGLGLGSYSMHRAASIASWATWVHTVLNNQLMHSLNSKYPP